MYQAALGGYYLNSTQAYTFNNNPVYYEPGYTIMNPLEIEVPQCDLFYILIRKRTSTGTYASLSGTSVSITAKDITTGEVVPFIVSSTLSNSSWDQSPSFKPIQIQIINSLNLFNSTIKVGGVDILVSDKNDNTFIFLRITISDSGRFFHFLPVDTEDMENRYKFTSVGTECYFITKRNTDSYVLFSPYCHLTETTRDDLNMDFSYPLDTIFYKRQKTYNDEEFEFSISSTSHDFVNNNLTLINVPRYRKVAVVHVDARMYKELELISENAYVNIESVGTLTGITDTFKINFVR